MATRKLQGAAHWATYLINGDHSGLNEAEIAECDAWMNRELADNEEIVDCGEPYFSWHYGLHTGSKFNGGDLVEYTVCNRGGRKTMLRFRDLSIGDTFDFIDDANPTWNSFYARCVKLSARTYTEVEGEDLHTMRVGSINTNVHHVERRKP